MVKKRVIHHENWSGDFEMCDKKELPIIIGRNDGCDTCDELGYICEDCIEEWLGDED